MRFDAVIKQAIVTAFQNANAKMPAAHAAAAPAAVAAAEAVAPEAPPKTPSSPSSHVPKAKTAPKPKKTAKATAPATRSTVDVVKAIRVDIKGMIEKGTLPKASYDVAYSPSAKGGDTISVQYSSLLDLFVPASVPKKALPAAVRDREAGYTELTLTNLLASHAKASHPHFSYQVLEQERHATRATVDELDAIKAAVSPKFHSLGDAVAQYRDFITDYLDRASS